jgi:hypothetical protein
MILNFWKVSSPPEPLALPPLPRLIIYMPAVRSSDSLMSSEPRVAPPGPVVSRKSTLYV